ncbi:MAG: DUF5924 family protein, partial [Natronospirillum sp.]
KRVASNRWLFPLYHGFALFALLLTALPIVIHMTTAQSYLVALVIAGLISIPMVTRTVYGLQWWVWPSRILLLLGMGLAGYLVEPWVPPATLWVTDVAITHHVDEGGRDPSDRLFNVAEEKLNGQGLYAFTSVRAPLGLKEIIYHEWRHEGKLIDRIPLIIEGGREAGYRSWSQKDNFPPDPSGRWEVKVVTVGNQMIGRRDFVVVN